MNESTAHVLDVTDLTRQFIRRGKPFNAVNHVNLSVDAGEFVAIVGRSGNGKSTLINMVAGLIRPTSGTIQVDGQCVADLPDTELSMLRNRIIGFMTQSHTLLANLTVLDNVILPATMFAQSLPFTADGTNQIDTEDQLDDAIDTLEVADDPDMPDTVVPFNQTKSQAKESNPRAQQMTVLASRARNLLAQLGIAELADSYPRELSGGEMRRVSIARALMNQPKLLIADEPTGDLDQESTDIVMRLLKSQAEQGMAILMVTHDSDALAYADKVYRMDAGTLSMG